MITANSDLKSRHPIIKYTATSRSRGSVKSKNDGRDVECEMKVGKEKYINTYMNMTYSKLLQKLSSFLFMIRLINVYFFNASSVSYLYFGDFLSE